MKKIICSFVLFCVSVSFCLANSTALDYYREGKFFQQRDDFTNAIEQYQEALLVNPDYAEAWIALAECAYEMDEYKRALSCLETASKYYKYNLKIQHLKGFCLIGLGDLQKATEVFNNTLIDYPNDIESLFGLAQLQAFEGKFSAAEKYYVEALSRESTNKKALLSLALISLKLDKIEQAENFINQAISHHNNNPEVYYYASYISLQKGNLEESEGFIRTALKLNPKYDKANALLAYILYAKGKYEQTVEVCDFRISQNRNNSEAWYLKSCAIYKLGAIEQAIKSLETVLKINPQDEVARYFLEQLVCENLEIEDARRKNYALYHVNAAQESVEKFNSNSALFEYIKALKIHPLNLEVRLSYANWLLNEGYPEAFLSQLKFIETQGVVSQTVSDKIESYDSLLENTIANRWDLDPFYLDKSRISIGLYYKNDNVTLLHPDSSKVCASLIADSFSAFPYFNVSAYQNSVKSYSQAFNNARKSNYDYFGIVNFDENERENSISIDLYVTATGSLAKKWNVYRTGNKKLFAAVEKLVLDMVSSFETRGKILQRKSNQVLIDLGKRDGITLDSYFVVAKKDEVKIADSGIGLILSEDMELGFVELIEVGEDISVGTFVQKGFYDKMNPNDEIFLVAKDTDKEKSSNLKAQPEKTSPELLEMLNSIK